MATYYWVGGTGTWDATTTTNWSLSSGGSGSAGVPTLVDDVIINSASAGAPFTITGGVATCRSVTVTTTATNKLTFNDGSFNIYGSLDFQAGTTGIVNSNSIGSALNGTINFRSTTTGNIVNFNGINCNSNTTFNGVGGEWTLTSALICGYAAARSLNFTAGSFLTGNFAITNFYGILSTGALTRSISLGSSTITCRCSITGFAWNVVATGLTLNAGTSNIIVTNDSTSTIPSTFTGGGFTYSTVTLNTTQAQVTINDVNTFANLTITGANSLGTRRIIFGANQTITGTLAFNGSATVLNRSILNSTVLGTQRTLTVNAVSGLQNTDFQSIAITGVAAPLSGTSLGDAQNNSGITFTASKNCYFVGGANGSWGGANWALSSGGGGATANFPLAQDNVIYDNVCGNPVNISSTGTTTLGGYFCNNFDSSARTTTLSMSTGNSSALTVLGNFTLSAATTYTGNSSLFIGGVENTTFNTNGGTINTGSAVLNNGVVIAKQSTASVTLSTLTLATSLVLTTGVLDFTNATITVTTFLSSGTSTRTVAFGASGVLNVTQTGAIVVNLGSTGITVTGSNPVINCTYSGAFGTRTIVGNTSISINITAGTDVISGPGKVLDLNFTGFSGTYSATATTVQGNLTLSPTMVTSATGNNVQMAALSGTGAKTITTNGVVINFILGFIALGGPFNLQDNLTTGNLVDVSTGTLNTNNFTLNLNRLSTGASGTLNLGTSTVTITGNATTVLSIASGTITATGTPTINCTYSGATGTRALIGSFNVNVNITAGTDIVSFSGNTNDINFTGFAGTIANATRSVFGNLTIPTGSTISAGALITTFSSTSGTKTITTNGVTLDFPITFSGVGGTWSLQDNLTVGSTRITLLNIGTLDLNDKILTTGLFSSSSSNTRTLAFRSIGAMYVTGTGSSLWGMSITTGFTATGSKNVYITDSSSTLRTISPGTLSEANALNFYITAGTGQLSLASNSYGTLDLTGSSVSVFFSSGITVFKDLVFSSSMSITATSFGINLSGTNNAFFNGAGILASLQITIAKTSPASVTLIGNLNIDVAKTLTLTSGTLNANNYNITAGIFIGTGSNIRTLNMGSGTWTILNAGISWSLTTVTNLTFNANTSNIDMTAATAKTFTGGGLTYYNLNQGGAGALTISGANTFNNLTNTVQPTTVTFTTAVAQIFTGAFLLSGTAGNLVTINTTVAGTRVTLRKLSPWYMGANSTNVSNNLNLIFTAGDGIDYLSVQDIQGQIANSVSVTETATYTDSQNAIILIVLDMVESMSLSESMAVGSVLTGSIADTITFTDSRIGNYLFTLTVNENSTITDSYVGGFQVNASINENLTGTDTNIGEAGFAGAYADTVTYTDSMSALAAYIGVNADAITLTATQVVNRDTSPVITETTTIADVNIVSASFSGLNAETVTLTDALASIVSFVATAAETATFTDSYTGGILFLATCSDAITLGEALGNLSNYAVNYSDSISVTDTLAGGIFFALNLAESLTATNVQSGAGFFIGAVQDLTTLNDIKDATVLFTVDLGELMGLEDQSTPTIDYVVVLSELITLTTFAYYEGWFTIQTKQASNWTNVDNSQG